MKVKRVSKIWVRTSTTNIHLLQSIQNKKQKTKTKTKTKQKITRIKKMNAGISGLIPKRNRLKYLTMHSPFCCFIRKILKLNGHPDYFGICVNKSASLKEHFFFLRKLYVSFEKVKNNMIGNIISFYRIFVLSNLDVWFRNNGKSCEVRPDLFGLIH